MSDGIKGLPYNPYSIAFLDTAYKRRVYFLIFADTGEKLMKLSNSAKNLYLHLSSVLCLGGNVTDVVHISPIEYSKKCKELSIKFSRSGFFKARKELIDAQIIYPAMTQTAYYVNPNIVYAGRRKELIKKYEEEAKQNIELYTKMQESIDAGKATDDSGKV